MRLTIDGTGFRDAHGEAWRMIADTAWRLAYKSTRPEVIRYLDDRAARGFNTILTVAVMEAALPRNRFGDKPFVGTLFSALDPGYWGHIDFIVTEANRRGLWVGLVPVWALTLAERLPPDMASRFGRLLGERFATGDVLWVLGGDRPERWVDATRWARLTEGLREGGYGGLVTYHTAPGNNEFAAADWQDFISLQTGHRAKADVRGAVRAHQEYGKPIVLLEPAYEGIQTRWSLDQGRITAEVVERQAAQARSAGAAGIGYGHNAIWFWNLDGREDGTHVPTGQDRPWVDGLGAPGADRVIAVWR